MTSLKTMMVVSDPAIAAFVAEAGLDRLFVDLEVHGKAARQPGDTWKSALTLADIPPIRAAAPGVEMMVRVNPLHPGTGEEIDGALAAGADILMLPMVRTLAEIARFHDLLAARAPFIPLLETAAGVALVAEILAGPRPAEVYFGLN
ncbi:MAG: aldolase/citrate lyase family protein, partial [Pseudomonadota bacterium]